MIKSNIWRKSGVIWPKAFAVKHRATSPLLKRCICAFLFN